MVEDPSGPNSEVKPPEANAAATTGDAPAIPGTRRRPGLRTCSPMDSCKLPALRFLLLLLLLFPLLRCDPYPLLVSADEIVTSSSGRAFGRSSREPKYKVEIHPVNSPFYPEEGQESVAMSNKEGCSYMCFMPMIEETKNSMPAAPQNSSRIIIESERRVKLKTPDELLDVLKDRCFYNHESWWSYEFCYQKHVKQVHLENDQVVQEFVLGVFDPEATDVFNKKHADTSMLKDPRAKDASQRYHAHQYTNGTICDLTNQPRETEVRFVCSEPNVVVSSIKEISTCKYVTMVHSPMLCKHPMFQQERPTWHTIHCNEIPGDIEETSAENGHKSTQLRIVSDDGEKYAT